MSRCHALSWLNMDIFCHIMQSWAMSPDWWWWLGLLFLAAGAAKEVVDVAEQWTICLSFVNFYEKSSLVEVFWWFLCNKIIKFASSGNASRAAKIYFRDCLTNIFSSWPEYFWVLEPRRVIYNLPPVPSIYCQAQGSGSKSAQCTMTKIISYLYTKSIT